MSAFVLPASEIADHPARARRRPDGLLTEPALRWFGCLALLVMCWCAVLWVIHAHGVLDHRERTLLAASTAKGFAEYVGLHILITDRMLLTVRQDFESSGAIPTQAHLAADFGHMAPLLLQVAVSDAQGRIVASSLPLASGVSIADRPHFQALRDDPRDRLHVSQPVVGRVSGRMSLQLVRPRRGVDGTFQGVIVASIDPLKLQQYFGSVDALADGGTVLIAGRDDGVVRARFAEHGITWGQSLLRAPEWARLTGEAAGSYEGVSVIDHVPHIVGFHRVAQYPLFVSVSSPAPGWDARQDSLSVAIAVAFSMVAVGYTRVLARRQRDQSLVITRLHESREREIEASRMKSNFLASVSHELRTPLNAILGFSELIRDVPDDPSNIRYADLIHTAGSHLLALLNTLLDLAKIEAGRMEVSRESVDVRALVATLAEMHGVAATRKGLVLELDFVQPEGGNFQVATDRTKLVQVLNNVLHNAVKFTDAGTIRVEARAEASTLVLRVTDTGRGIPPARLARVFDRFATGAESGHEPGAGTGLGLALSRDLMQLLGGSIAISSGPAAGTEVTLRLPGPRPAGS